MSYLNERQGIEVTFKQGWDASAVKSIPLYFENQAMPRAEDLPEEYCVLYIRPADGQQTAIGLQKPRFTYQGFVGLTIRTQLAEGTNKARQVADEVTKFLRAKQVLISSQALLRFRVPFLTIQGQREGRFCADLTTNFEREEF